MADLGLAGWRRGRVWARTTEGDDRLDRPADLVERRFRAPAPNPLWVADLTYVKTHAGWVYVAFIVDVCGVDAREVGRDDRGGLGSNELAPGWVAPIGRRVDTGGAKDLPHG